MQIEPNQPDALKTFIHDNFNNLNENSLKTLEDLIESDLFDRFIKKVESTCLPSNLHSFSKLSLIVFYFSNAPLYAIEEKHAKTKTNSEFVNLLNNCEALD